MLISTLYFFLYWNLMKPFEESVLSQTSFYLGNDLVNFSSILEQITENWSRKCNLIFLKRLIMSAMTCLFKKISIFQSVYFNGCNPTFLIAIKMFLLLNFLLHFWCFCCSPRFLFVAPFILPFCSRLSESIKILFPLHFTYLLFLLS